MPGDRIVLVGVGIAFYAGVFALGLTFAASTTLAQHLTGRRSAAPADSAHRLTPALSEE